MGATPHYSCGCHATASLRSKFVVGVAKKKKTAWRLIELLVINWAQNVFRAALLRCFFGQQLKSFKFSLKVGENHENSGTSLLIFINRDMPGT